MEDKIKNVKKWPTICSKKKIIYTFAPTVLNVFGKTRIQANVKITIATIIYRYT